MIYTIGHTESYLVIIGGKTMNNENKLFDNSFDPPMECSFQVSQIGNCTHDYRYLETTFDNDEKTYVFYCTKCLEIVFKKI